MASDYLIVGIIVLVFLILIGMVVILKKKLKKAQLAKQIGSQIPLEVMEDFVECEKKLLESNGEEDPIKIMWDVMHQRAAREKDGRIIRNRNELTEIAERAQNQNTAQQIVQPQVQHQGFFKNKNIQKVSAYESQPIIKKKFNLLNLFKKKQKQTEEPFDVSKSEIPLNTIERGLNEDGLRQEQNNSSNRISEGQGNTEPPVKSSGIGREDDSRELREQPSGRQELQSIIIKGNKPKYGSFKVDRGNSKEPVSGVSKLRRIRRRIRN